MAHIYTKLRAQQSGSIAWRKRERMRAAKDVIACISQQVVDAWARVCPANDLHQEFYEKWAQRIRAEGLKEFQRCAGNYIRTEQEKIDRYIQSLSPEKREAWERWKAAVGVQKPPHEGFR